MEKYELSIVIASSWRLGIDLEDIRIALKDLNIEIIGITPELNDPFVHHPRHVEVELYLKQTNQKNNQWFAIDDTPAFYRPNAPVVYTDSKKGFVINDCAQVEQIINKLT